eukprot:scaffold4320_cov172-Ochromonas_danica.AAC.1
MTKEKFLTVDKTVMWLTSLLSKPPHNTDPIAIQLQPLTRSTVHEWMLAAGADYHAVSKTYYTDNHDTPDNIKYRDGEFIPRWMEISKRSPEWIVVPVNSSLKNPTLVPAMEYTLSVAGTKSLPVFEEGSKDSEQCTMLHVDYLPDDLLDLYRASCLKKYGMPGVTFLKPEEISNLPKPTYCRHSSDVCKCNSI